MPVPIALVNNGSDKEERKYYVDFSFLANQMDNSIVHEAHGRFVHATDSEADLLMKIWLSAEKKDSVTFKVTPSLNLSMNDLSNLSRRGLIALKANEISFTPKGKSVITLMVMGESNNFKKNEKKKNYTEILASMNKRGKTGYRVPKIAADSHLIRM